MRSFHLKQKDELEIGKLFHARSLSHSIDDLDMRELVTQVAKDHAPIEKEIRSIEGYWYLFRIMPYAVSDTVYAGVILTFVDIDQLTQIQNELKQRKQDEMERLASFVHYSNDAITLQDETGQIISWNRGAEKLYGWSVSRKH